MTIAISPIISTINILQKVVNKNPCGSRQGDAQRWGKKFPQELPAKKIHQQQNKAETPNR